MRREGWPEKLHEYLALDHKFSWVNNNCALFAAGAVLAITGIDYVTDFRLVKTKVGLLKKLKNLGGIDKVLSGFFGEDIQVLTARRGDVVIIPVFIDTTRRVDAVGICLGSEVAVLTLTGITNYPLSDAKRAWRVV